MRIVLTESRNAELFENKRVCNIKELEDYLIKKQKGDIKDLITKKPKLRFYKQFKCDMHEEEYVSFNLKPKERSILAQLRMGILPLAIETGRFINQPLEQRLCALCDGNKIEDEWHFIFNCPIYNDKRDDFFSGIVEQNPEFVLLEENEQMKYLFKTAHRKFAKDVEYCFRKRRSILFPT